MITLVYGTQTYTCSEEEAAAILKIQAVMKATKWELPSQTKEDGTTIRRGKNINKRSATTKGTEPGDNSSEQAKVSHRDSTDKE